MGYYIKYELDLIIPRAQIERALEIFNYLHTPEMLKKHARGGSFGGGREEHWYSFVDNPSRPYNTIQEAFENWCIVDEGFIMGTHAETGDFFIHGSYASKWGQQDFLIEQLAPVLRDTRIEVTGEDKMRYLWIVEKHQFSREELPPLDDEDDEA